MKKMLISALVLMMSASAFAKTPHEHAVKVVSTKMDVVYFKVSCDLIGAAMKIYDTDGRLIMTSKVTDKKVIVDFFAEPSGTYTIHVQKDGSDEAIVYNKETVSHAERASASFITVTQM